MDSYINLYWYGSRWYDDSLARFIQPDTIIPDLANPQSWNRYTYVLGNPIKYNDPSGHVECDSLENCSPSRPWSTAQLTNFAFNLFSWKISGNVSRNQVKNIISAGNLIKSYIDKSTSNQGVNWVRANLVSTTFARSQKTVTRADKLRASAYVWLYNTVNLGAADVSANVIIHELGHVLDNNNAPSLIPATVFGGGPADDMVRDMGGHPLLNPIRMHYGGIQLSLQKPFVSFPMNTTGYIKYVAGNNPWSVDDINANHGVADDFAQTFRYTITGENNLSPQRLSWMEAYLSSLDY